MSFMLWVEIGCLVLLYELAVEKSGVAECDKMLCEARSEIDDWWGLAIVYFAVYITNVFLILLWPIAIIWRLVKRFR